MFLLIHFYKKGSLFCIYAFCHYFFLSDLCDRFLTVLFSLHARCMVLPLASARVWGREGTLYNRVDVAG